MNWDAIGAVGELVGAAGVIVSLLYLATQIRHGAKTSEDSATREVFSAVSVHIASMVEESNREVLVKGLVSYSQLSGPEKFAFDGLISSLMVLVESSYISNSAELLDDESMENWSFYLRTRLLAYEGMREWWEESKGIYVPASQEWVDTQIARTDLDSDFWGIKS